MRDLNFDDEDLEFIDLPEHCMYCGYLLRDSDFTYGTCGRCGEIILSDGDYLEW